MGIFFHFKLSFAITAPYGTQSERPPKHSSWNEDVLNSMHVDQNKSSLCLVFPICYLEARNNKCHHHCGASMPKELNIPSSRRMSASLAAFLQKSFKPTAHFHSRTAQEQLLCENPLQPLLAWVSLTVLRELLALSTLACINQLAHIVHNNTRVTVQQKEHHVQCARSIITRR